VDYAKLTVPKLKALAKERGLTGYSKLLKPALVTLLGETEPAPEPVPQVNAEAVAKVNQAREANAKRKLRNKRKAQRRALRAAGHPA